MKKILVFLLFAACSLAATAQNPILYLLVGTYTGSPQEGIYIFRFNPNKGEATFVSKATGVMNPTYLAISKDQQFVYAVNETKGDASPGEVSAFSLDKKKGELKFLNKQATGGDDPCYVTVDSSGRNVIVANYSGGNLALFKTSADGTLKPALQTLGHEGYGVNVTRQEMPHPHSANLSPDEKFVFVPDLGNDRIYKYKFNAADAAAPLTDGDPQYYQVPDGSGPRHMAFSPNGKFAYVINELSGQLTVYSYANGALTELQTIASTTAGDKADRGSADVHITPDGKFLYTSNRGKANDITIYKTLSDGHVNEVGHQAVGNHPRNFMIDPTGHFLLVGNRDDNNITVYIINKNYGLLEATGTKIEVPKPSCLKMVPVR